ncbi:sensor histidine kinase [Kitasatospora sp. NPDC056076]|uniref:sensor histidine kinase n=1 Tax=Kitasatospora sp. NPDC056076 TaxID=3345703 RepID=UPI0035DD34AB
MIRHPLSRSWRPRTLRARTTAAVGALLLTAMAGAGALVVTVMHSDLQAVVQDEARRQAVSGLGVTPRSDAGRSLPAAGEPATPGPGAPGPTAPSPSPLTVGEAPALVTPENPPEHSEWAANGGLVSTAMVDPEAAHRALHRMLLWTAPVVLLLVAAGTWLTWAALGRVLAPVEALRREVSDITSTDLHRRLPVPEGRDEVARLATAMNTTLERLDRAVGRLRTFTGDVSHELRSPLSVLRTRLELALAHPAGVDWPGTAAEALKDTEQLQDLVDDLLLLARVDAHRPGREQPVDLAALALAQADARALPAGIAVDVTAPGPAPVLGIPSHLSRLLTNLVDNARRHARSAVRVRVASDGGLVTLEVTDDGPGIPAADRERVFERFTRLDEARTRDDGGAGLGLAIAKAVATAHQGTLTAEEPTAPHGGARLVLRLPAGAAS